jgi:hypothetical protein
MIKARNLTMEVYTSSLSKEIREQTQWENSITELKSDMDGKMSDMDGKMDRMMKDITTMMTIGRDTDKLGGAIDKYQQRLDQLRQTTDDLSEKTSQAISAATKASIDITSAKKDYTSARDELTTLHDSALEELRNTSDDIKKSEGNSPTGTTQSSPFIPYLKPNEYMVNKLRISIRGEDFNKDSAPIICDSSDDILSTYEYIASLASQYGIIIQPSDSVNKWIDPVMNATAPTFGLDPLDFDSYELARRAYTSMSHALATKLTTSVKFGSNFKAAKFIVHEHEKDGFKMLYDLIALVHPGITSDLSNGPKNPVFEGDIHAYMNKFKNFIDYEYRCNRIYESHEQADYVISAIKASQWHSNLEKGLNEVVQKLDSWKRSPSAHHTSVLPYAVS